jgi:transglutaminase superfamily protein
MALTLRDLRFRSSLWLWSKLVPLMAHDRELAALLALTCPPAATPYRGLAADHIVKSVKSSCRRPWLMRKRRCLREGLLAFRFLSMAGHTPVLRFGVERGSVARGQRLSAHCWIEVENEKILNPPLPGIVEILCHPRAAADPIGACTSKDRGVS